MLPSAAAAFMCMDTWPSHSHRASFFIGMSAKDVLERDLNDDRVLALRMLWASRACQRSLAKLWLVLGSHACPAAPQHHLGGGAALLGSDSRLWSRHQMDGCLGD